MPLRYVDPTKRRSAVTRGLNRLARTRVGLFVGKHLASKTDPMLSRITGGRLSWGAFNVPSATLRTTGAKSGRVRDAQVAYYHDGRDVIIMASNYGGAAHPQWYHNLVAHPECELGGEPFLAREVTDPDEYARLYGLAETYYGGFSDYRENAARAGRTVPVFRLCPR
ncbi:nitroreductase/quinone reductase family protein [Mycobacterium sp. 1274761.0]|uniref:nitroreductase/quinone reductase family protein n=1 Tax=Mycobacterium sp. 1274761.0 TaxID=1834077 RepID=UPI0007FB7313|nr:nitroreductase [Mycobacterium sp. 1274761.0]